MLSTGNIKKYQIVMGSIYIGSFILCYLFFKCGLGPEFGYISTIMALTIALFVRLRLIKEIIEEFSAKEFFLQAIVKSLEVIIFSSVLVSLFKHFVLIDNKFIELGIILVLSMASVVLLSLLFALSKSEKNMIMNQIKSIIKKK